MSKRKKQKWAVYYCSREYAQMRGDPCLGYVWASSKEEADRMARAAGMGGVGGAWCTLVRGGSVLATSMLSVSGVG